MTEEQTTSTPDQGKRPRKRLAVALATVAAVVVVAGVGLFVWHEQPSFCAAICHSPMDPYLPTYETEPGQATQDKWGNEVADAGAMLAASHRSENGDTCMSCHVPTLSEQVSEGIGWLTGDYYDPLSERTLDQLTAARGVDGEQFCLNEACHDFTRDQLVEMTADLEFNPHVSQHEERDCSDCHKAHRASVMVCAQCHTQAEVPQGWISPVEDATLMKPIAIAEEA